MSRGPASAQTVNWTHSLLILVIACVLIVQLGVTHLQLVLMQ